MYRTITPQKAFEVRLRLFFENLLWIFDYSLGAQTQILVSSGYLSAVTGTHYPS